MINRSLMVLELGKLTKGHMEPVFVIIESSDFNPVRFCIVSIKMYNK